MERKYYIVSNRKKYEVNKEILLMAMMIEKLNCKFYKIHSKKLKVLKN